MLHRALTSPSTVSRPFCAPRSPSRAGLLAGVAASVLLVGCNRSTPAGSLSQANIVDEVHDNGTVGFLWMPPMVPRPANNGDVVVDALPTVEIDRIDDATHELSQAKLFAHRLVNHDLEATATGVAALVGVSLA